MARSDSEKQSDTKRTAKPADKRSTADNTQQQRAITDDAKLRSDWEGMAPKPDQNSDDVAAPGKLPENRQSGN